MKGLRTSVTGRFGLGVLSCIVLQGEQFPALDFARTAIPGEPNTTIEATLVSSSAVCHVYVDARIASRISKPAADGIAMEFERRIYPIVTQHFGPVPDGDRNGRIIVILQSTGRTDIEGYHLYGNLVHPTAPREIVYINSALVENNSPRTYPALAHELQHLIAGKRRIDRGRYEGRWIDEGLSVFAEYLSGYGHNQSHIRGFASFPGTSLKAFSNSNGPFPDHGAAYSFLFYLFEQGVPPEHRTTLSQQYHQFVRAAIAAGLPEYLDRGGKFAELFRGWTITNYLDPYLNTSALASAFPEHRYADLDLFITIPGRQRHRLCRTGAVPSTELTLQPTGAQYALFEPDVSLAEPARVNLIVGGLQAGQAEAWAVLHDSNGALEIKQVPSDGRLAIDGFFIGGIRRVALVLINQTDTARGMRYSAEVLQSGPCVFIGGDWQATEEGTLACTFSALGETETDTERIRGAGRVTVIQEGCSINYIPPILLSGVTPAEAASLRRTGTVSGTSINMEGRMGVPTMGITFTENILRVTGEYGGGTISLRGDGKLTGSGVIENVAVTFNCTAATTARFVPASACGANTAVATSAASFFGTSVSPNSMVSAFGTNLSSRVQVATTTPLPTSLAGVEVLVKDSVGAERPAPLFFVSSGQVNFLVPPETALGAGTLTIRRSGTVVGVGSLTIEVISPSLFTADASGQGVAQAQVIRISANGSRSIEPVYRCTTAPRGCYSIPIDLGPAGDQVYVSLFGTGIRGLASGVTATVGGVDIPAAAAAQGTFAGLDQVNLGPLPRSLSGQGELGVIVAVDDRATNMVTISVR